jgi:hypothetical protein
MSNQQDTSQRKLSPEARELIRGYLLKVCIPSGVALTVVSFALGFLINDVARKDAYMTAYAKAYEEAMKSQSTVVSQSAARIAEAEVNAKTATKSMTDALAIAEKIKGMESLAKADAQISIIAKELAANPDFASRVNVQLTQQLATTNKWVRNIYAQAAQTGMPGHQGANGWWQKNLIDASPAVTQELK